MTTNELRAHLKSAWLKLTPKKRLFFTLLTEHINQANAETPNFKVDEISVAELFLALIYKDMTQQTLHEYDVLAKINSHSIGCTSSHCILFASAINAVLDELLQPDELLIEERAAFAAITQVMCTECIYSQQHTRSATSEIILHIPPLQDN